MKKQAINAHLSPEGQINIVQLEKKIKQINALILKVKARRIRYENELDQQVVLKVKKQSSLLEKALSFFKLNTQSGVNR